jgi:uncharacterized protein (DUF1684 family)
MKRTALFILITIVACSPKPKIDMSAEQLAGYKKEIDAWHIKRLDEVKAPNGWLNLAGLFWLEDGANTFGSGPENNVLFPANKIAGQAGEFFLANDQVTIKVNPAVDVIHNGKKVTEEIIFHPDSTHVIELASGSLRWNIIKRDKKLGVRLRDDESELIKNFKGVPRFEVDPAFRVDAVFIKKDSLHTIDVTNMIGQTTPQASAGTLEFALAGKTYSLDVLEGNAEEFFIVFGDKTTGKETYGGGRFLYVKKPDANGRVLIDFNKAYNPPCVFTPYATCPLPPKQNKLDIEILAGELSYEENH